MSPRAGFENLKTGIKFALLLAGALGVSSGVAATMTGTGYHSSRL